ncbi:hypothetical protein HNQ02_003827 [Flavobacterium sp. 7E]|uniref:hypothetical protein n=1 Tax=Flavobacterium sp. 7E TaxID=2735898 RepID=UPI00156D4533|nr:hypothetical protein [Flavobacterium sp. 7E]NRS90880.1 hypothetical protein [Flavobacterium sp. 7E]
MKYVIIILLSLASCKQQNLKESFILPNTKDINSIVEEIVYSEKSPVFEDNKKTIHPIPFCINLKKMKLINWNQKQNEFPPRIMWNSFIIQELIGYNNLPHKFFEFEKTDSSYIKFQIENLSEFKVGKTISKKFFSTTLEIQAQIDRSIFYYLTIPIISKNGRTAYCELTLKCSGLCGSGYEIYLKKIEDKWGIYRIKNKWVS